VLAPLSRRMDDEEWWPPEAFPQIGAAGFMGITGARAPTAARAWTCSPADWCCQAFARWNPRWR
jgi:isovaleryl-CoA dehydrogenase